MCWLPLLEKQRATRTEMEGEIASYAHMFTHTPFHFQHAFSEPEWTSSSKVGWISAFGPR